MSRWWSNLKHCGWLAAVCSALSLLLPAAASAAFASGPQPFPVPGGDSVAVSQDGSVVVVGEAGLGDPAGSSNLVGGMYVYGRGPNGYVKSGPYYLPALQERGNDRSFGQSVAVSADGTVAIVGDPGGEGHAEVFSITLGADGTPNVSELGLMQSPCGCQFGTSVAVAHTQQGSTFVVGAPGANTVFVTTSPTDPGAGFVDGTTSSADEAGASVAITPDAATILVGAPNRGIGGAVDEMSPGGGLHEALSGVDGGGELGASVAVSASGVAIAGEPFSPSDSTDAGKAVVFQAFGTAPSSPSLPTTLTPGSPVAGEAFGSSVSLTSDGLTALVGAPFHGYHGANSTPGSSSVAGYAYVEDAAAAGGSPTEQVLAPPAVILQNCVHVGTDCQGIPGSYFGQTVGLAADGSAAVVGAPEDDWDTANGAAEGYSNGFSFLWTRAPTSTGGGSTGTGSGNPGSGGGNPGSGTGTPATGSSGEPTAGSSGTGGTTGGGSDSGSGAPPKPIPVYGPKLLINPATGLVAITYFCPYGLSYTDPCQGGITVPIYCVPGQDTTPYTPCFGVAVEVFVPTGKSRHHKSVLRFLARTSFTIAAGHKGTIRLRLSRKALKILHHRRRIKATMVITIRQGTHRYTRTEHVTFTLGPRRRHRH